MEWKSIKDGMPDPGHDVLVVVEDDRKKRHILRAFWCPRFYLEASEYETDDVDEYSEDNDQYYLREGWYEHNAFEETHWFVEETVTHWMHLPKLPNRRGDA